MKVTLRNLDMEQTITDLLEEMKKDRETMKQDRETINKLIAQLTTQRAEAHEVSLHKDLAERMEKFDFDAEENKTFEKWFARYQTIFEVNAAAMSDAEKVCLLTEKLSSSDFDKFANAILPLDNASIPFVDAVKKLKDMFGRKELQFSLRYQCLKVNKEESESYTDYRARVNLKCEKFNLEDITSEDFKVLIFVKGLQSTQDSADRKSVV